MRGPIAWILGIVAGIGVVLVVTAAIGNRDKSGETVPASAWAQSTCGAVGTWRGEMEAIVDEVRQAPSTGASGVEEPQSQTPQGRTALVRAGLERAVRATKTLVTGVDNAGTPDSPQGADAAKLVSDWADASVANLEKAQDSLDHEATTLEAAIAQLTGAAGAIRTTLGTGVQTIADVTRLDPELATALRDSSTCQQLREEQTST
jgi:hypothetical protein